MSLSVHARLRKKFNRSSVKTPRNFRAKNNKVHNKYTKTQVTVTITAHSQLRLGHCFLANNPNYHEKSVLSEEALQTRHP